MSCEELQKPYQQRFKGVENFLRRVAFNLGNTASQTEVKIISCIPIDVTDLQQKIINLEKQLHEAKKQNGTEEVGNQPKDDKSDKPDKTDKSDKTDKTDKNDKPNKSEKQDKPDKPNKRNSVANTAQHRPSLAKQSNTVSCCSKRTSNMKAAQGAMYYGDCCSSKRKKSNVSFVFPALSTPDVEHDCKFSSHVVQLKDSNSGNVAGCNLYKNIFRRRKRKRSFSGKSKQKTHLVYFAHQTANNPFEINEVPLNISSDESDRDMLCLSYLNSVIQRQYDPSKVIHEFSDTSDFTRPTCRDVSNKYRCYSEYESDICSCLHGNFQNVDKYMTNLYYEPIQTKNHNSFSNTDLYYDSNLYDVIPVKESENKVLKEKDETKNETRPSIDIKCWPENFRTKPKYQPFIMNYECEIPNNRRFIQKTSEKAIKQKNKPQNICDKRERRMKLDQETAMESSKSCCIDCGVIYPKKFTQISKSPKVIPLSTILQKNESVATDVEDTRLQVNNQSTQLELKAADDSRELTLNEIKSILHSVLEEVKTSVKINFPPETVKKDAVIQKGASQNSMEGDSTLINSFTYNNSYNTSPYGASCSKNMAHGPFCVTSVPMQPLKYLQNFPVFIQPARHMCTCYYRKSISKPQPKQASNAATNTDKDTRRPGSKETEKLIKEIYKSMALNLDFPTKINSSCEYNDLKSSENISKISITKKVKNATKKDISSTRKDIEVETPDTFFQPKTQNKLVYAAASTQAEYKKSSSVAHFNEENVKDFDNDNNLNDLEYYSSDTIIGDDETYESSNESEDTVIYEEKIKQDNKTKQGFFNRMFKSVNLFKKKKEIPKQHYNRGEEITDSDEYETIYIENTEPSSKSYIGKKCDRRIKSFDPGHSRKIKRSPYLEQEYRRQWNEKIMFHEQQSNRSSDRPFSRQSNSKQRPVYYTNYEARSAIIDDKLPNDRKILTNGTHNEEKAMYVDRNNSFNAKEKVGWLKKHKLGVNCGEQWKRFILEN